MQRDIFSPQQFPLLFCLKGSEMSLAKTGQVRVMMQRKHTRFCVTENKACQYCFVPHELPETDFRVCLCNPQQGANIILLAVSSFQVFSITLVHGLTSLLNSRTTCAFQLVQLFWPRELAGMKEIEPQKGGGGGEVTTKVIGLWRGKRVSVPVHYCCYAVVLPPKVCLLW